MSRKKTIEEVREIVSNLELGIELVSKEYINNKQKLVFKDIEGYFYFTKLNNLKSLPEKFQKTNPYTIQNINLWVKNNNKPFKLIENQIYNANDIDMKWQCLNIKCCEIFNSTWAKIHFNKGCPYCAGKLVGLSNCLATLNPELASEWHPTLNGDLTPFDVTCGLPRDIWWQCKNNSKHEWKVSLNNRTSQNSGCPYCNHILPSDDYNLLLDNPELCKEWDYNKNDKSPKEYTRRSKKYVWWKCKECRHEWEASIGSRNGGFNSGCPECSTSKGERECKRVFDLRKEYYIPQKKFDGLVGLGNGLLSYDFYLPQYKLLIEYQGEFHDGNDGKGNYFMKQNLEKQKEHDIRKKEYALKNRYNFLEIWYYDIDNVETILDEYINKLKIK